MPKKPNKDNPKCPICSNITVRNGIRKIKLRTYLRFLCKQCKHSFTLQCPYQSKKTYNLKTILDSISRYNLGTPLRKNQQVPKSTLHDWIKTLNLPMNRLRIKLKNIPEFKIIIKHRFIHHKQPFLYQYHSLKLEFAKKFPQLINYLKTIPKELPKDIFNNSQRISQVSKQKNEFEILEAKPNRIPEIQKGFLSTLNFSKKLNSKQNYAVELAKIASAITTNNKQRHNIIENFMLINDTATIAAEIPVYLTNQETKATNLTGHIDILQLRFHKLYILDYKPEPVNKSQTINQLFLYRKALSKRTQIPINKIHLAFFNENGYYEIERPT